VQLPGWGRHFTQHAVNSVPQVDALAKRLDMNIAGSVFDRLPNDQVDEANDRRLFSRLAQPIQSWIL
jgi:hypothetical protein